jgi:hypothetical protein
MAILKPFSKGLSLILAVVYFSTNALFGYSPESGFWSERNRAAREHRGGGTRVASLPGSRGGVGSAIVLPSLGVQIPALAPQRLRHLPFVRDHKEVFSALSPNLATVRDVSFPTKMTPMSPLVIHIQDVHHNLDAQRRIAALTRALTEGADRPVDVVALEGAWETIDPTPFREFSDRATVEQTMDQLLQGNKISGPVYAACTGSGPFPSLVGVDDSIHHGANVEAYRRAVPEMGRVQAVLKDQRALLEKEKPTVYSEKLLHWDAVVESYHSGGSSLGAYVTALVAHSPHLPPTVADFKRAFDLEKTINFQRVEQERTELLRALVGRLDKRGHDELLAQALAHRTGHLGYGDFYTGLESLCASAGVPLDRYPEFRRYIRYALTTDSVRAELLFHELALLERRVYSALVQTPSAGILVEKFRALRLMEKLADFSLTPTEWKDYGAIRNTPEVVSVNLAPFENFYEEAGARDGVMAENLLRALRSRVNPRASRAPLAILVSGGYHAPGLTEQFNAAGAVVISVVPKIDKIDSPQGSHYLSVFSREKTPLDKLFVGQKLFLATPPATGVLEAPFWIGLLKGSAQTAKELYHALRQPVRLTEVKINGESLVATFENAEPIEFSRNGNTWSVQPTSPSWFEANFRKPWRELSLSFPAQLSTQAAMTFIQKHLSGLDLNKNTNQIEKIFRDWLAGIHVWFRVGTLTGFVATGSLVALLPLNPWFWLPVFIVLAVPMVLSFHLASHVLYNIFHPQSRLAIGDEFSDVKEFLLWATSQRRGNPENKFSKFLVDAITNNRAPADKKKIWAVDASYAEVAWANREEILAGVRAQMATEGTNPKNLPIDEAQKRIREFVEAMPHLSSSGKKNDLSSSTKKSVAIKAGLILAETLRAGEAVQRAEILSVPEEANSNGINGETAIASVSAKTSPFLFRDEVESKPPVMRSRSHGGFSDQPLGILFSHWLQIIDWQIREKNLISYSVLQSNSEQFEVQLHIRPRLYPLKEGTVLHFQGSDGIDRTVSVKKRVEKGERLLTVVADELKTIEQLGNASELDAQIDPILPVLRTVLEVILRPQGPNEPLKRLFGLDGARETAWGIPTPLEEHILSNPVQAGEMDNLMRIPTVALAVRENTSATPVLGEIIRRLVVDQKKMVLLVGGKGTDDTAELLVEATQQSVPFIRVGRPPGNLSQEASSHWLSSLLNRGEPEEDVSDSSSTGLLVAGDFFSTSLDKDFSRLLHRNGQTRFKIFDAIVFVGLHKYPAIYSFIPGLYAKDGAHLYFTGKNRKNPVQVLKKNRELLIAGFHQGDMDAYATNAFQWVLAHSNVSLFSLSALSPDIFDQDLRIPDDPSLWDGGGEQVAEDWPRVRRWLESGLENLDEQISNIKTLGDSPHAENWSEAITDFMKVFNENFQLNLKVSNALNEWADGAPLTNQDELLARLETLRVHVISLAERGDTLLAVLSEKVSSLGDPLSVRAFLSAIRPTLTESMFSDLLGRLPGDMLKSDNELLSFKKEFDRLSAQARDVDSLTPSEWLQLLRNLDRMLNADGDHQSLAAFVDAVAQKGGENELEIALSLQGNVESLVVDAWDAAKTRFDRELELVSLEQVASDAESTDKAYGELFHRLFSDAGLRFEDAPEKIKEYVVSALAAYLYLVGTTARNGAADSDQPLSPEILALLAGYNRDLETLKLVPGQLYSHWEIHHQLTTAFKHDRLRSDEVLGAFGRLNGSHYLEVRQYLKSHVSPKKGATGWIGVGLSRLAGEAIWWGWGRWGGTELSRSSFVRGFMVQHAARAEDLLNVFVSVGVGWVAGQNLDLLAWLSLGTLSPPGALFLPVFLVLGVWFVVFFGSHLVAPKILEKIIAQKPSGVKAVRLFGFYLVPLLLTTLGGGVLASHGWVLFVSILIPVGLFRFVRAAHERINLEEKNSVEEIRLGSRLSVFLGRFIISVAISLIASNSLFARTGSEAESLKRPVKELRPWKEQVLADLERKFGPEAALAILDEQERLVKHFFPHLSEDVLRQMASLVRPNQVAEGWGSTKKILIPELWVVGSMEAFRTFVAHETAHILFPPYANGRGISLDPAFQLYRHEIHLVIYAMGFLRGMELGIEAKYGMYRDGILGWGSAIDQGINPHYHAGYDLAKEAWALERKSPGDGWNYLRNKLDDQSDLEQREIVGLLTSPGFVFFVFSIFGLGSLVYVLGKKHERDGVSTSQWGLLLAEWLGARVGGVGGRERFGATYQRFAALIEWSVSAKIAFWGFVGTIAFVDVALGWALAPLVGALYGVLFVASHFIPQSMAPVTSVQVGVLKTVSMGLIYGVLIGVTPFLLGAVPLLGVPEFGVQAAGVLWGMAGFLHHSFDLEKPREAGEREAWKFMGQVSRVQGAFEVLIPVPQANLTEQLMGKESSSVDPMTETLSRLETDREFRAGFVGVVQEAIAGKKLSGTPLVLVSTLLQSATGQPLSYLHVLGESPVEELENLELMMGRSEGPVSGNGLSVALVVSKNKIDSLKGRIDVLEAKGVTVFTVALSGQGWTRDVLTQLDHRMSPWFNKASGIVATVGAEVGIRPRDIEALDPESKLRAALENAVTLGDVIRTYLRYLQVLASNA